MSSPQPLSVLALAVVMVLVDEAAGTVELDLVEVALLESSDDFPVTTFTTYLILSAACFGRDLVGA